MQKEQRVMEEGRRNQSLREDPDSSPKLKLPLLLMTNGSAVHSPEHLSGTVTPPLQTPASVPFKWEEEPGKPRNFSDIINHPLGQPKSLELPPCRVQRQLFSDKTPSPTTVLDGPYNVGRPKFSSLRFFRDAHDFLDGGSSSSSGASPPGSGGDVDVLLLGAGGHKRRYFFGKLKLGKKEVCDFNGSFRLSSSNYSTPCSEWNGADDKIKGKSGKMRTNGSFCNVSSSGSTHIWTTIYEGLKHVMPWKSSRKSKKQAPF